MCGRLPCKPFLTRGRSRVATDIIPSFMLCHSVRYVKTRLKPFCGPPCRRTHVTQIASSSHSTIRDGRSPAPPASDLRRSLRAPIKAAEAVASSGQPPAARQGWALAPSCGAGRRAGQRWLALAVAENRAATEDPSSRPRRWSATGQPGTRSHLQVVRRAVVLLMPRLHRSRSASPCFRREPPGVSRVCWDGPRPSRPRMA